MSAPLVARAAIEDPHDLVAFAIRKDHSKYGVTR
jgi:hypothetical protein